MKLVLKCFCVLFSLPLLHGCFNKTHPIEIVSMDVLEAYLFDDSWQFVDLRSESEIIENGHIKGFETIAFHEEIVGKDIMSYHPETGFNPDHLHNKEELIRLFDNDKHIVLICRRGIRAHYVKEALEHLGYDNVYNAGSVGDYNGQYYIPGE